MAKNIEQITASTHEDGPDFTSEHSFTQDVQADTAAEGLSNDTEEIINEDLSVGERIESAKRWSKIVGAVVLTGALAYGGHSYVQSEREEAVVEHVLSRNGVRADVEAQIEEQYDEGVETGNISYDPQALRDPQGSQLDTGSSEEELAPVTEAPSVGADDIFGDQSKEID